MLSLFLNLRVVIQEKRAAWGSSGNSSGKASQLPAGPVNVASLLWSPWVFCTAFSHCNGSAGLHLKPDVYFLRAETGPSSSVWHIVLQLQPGTVRKPSKWCLTALKNCVKRTHFQKITEQQMSYNGRFKI